MRTTTGLLAAVTMSALAFAEDPKPTDWSAQMGDVPFVVGLEKGREEVKFTGRPAMLFFTSATDPWCPKFAARTWKDKQVLADVAGYTPVLVDADTAPKELKEKYLVVVLPAVVWLDFEETSISAVAGDTDLPTFKVGGSEVAKGRCPEPRAPAEGYAALLDLKKKLDEAKDVKSRLAVIADIRKVGLGAAVQAAAKAADTRITEDGDSDVGKAKGLLAAKKKPEAKKVLEKVLAEYPADHPVAKAAQELLDLVNGKKRR
jgi:hypothetical protein